MTTWAALLRGINVGKAKRIAMADLRALVEEAGYAQARTLLNSGNVVFAGAARDRRASRRGSRAAIEARVGFHSHVVVLDAAAMDMVVRETRSRRPTTLAPAGGLRAGSARLQSSATRDTGLGPGSTRWSARAPRNLGARGHPGEPRPSGGGQEYWGPYVTTRNWATVQKLHAMMHA